MKGGSSFWRTLQHWFIGGPTDWCPICKEYFYSDNVEDPRIYLNCYTDKRTPKVPTGFLLVCNKGECRKAALLLNQGASGLTQIQPGLMKIDPPPILQELAQKLGGTSVQSYATPDGSGFATMSMALPEDHWLYQPGENIPPMPWLTGTQVQPQRENFEKWITEAARYAIRASTMNGQEIDFDPDAMVRNFITGMLGYYTATGLSADEWANPKQFRGKPA